MASGYKFPGLKMKCIINRIMNYLTIILAFILVLPGVAQTKFSENQIKIINLELNRQKSDFSNKYDTKPIIGDSILVNRAVIKNDKSPDDLKLWLGNVKAKGLTASDYIDIFGKDSLELYDLNVGRCTEWTQEAFPNLKVSIYYEGKYKDPNTGKVKPLMAFSNATTLFLSVPQIRKDQKYALIQTSSAKHGGVLSIYKNTHQGWELYKNVILYYE